MVIWLSILIVSGATIAAIASIFNAAEGLFKHCILSIIIAICFIAGFCGVKIKIHKELYKIGQEIENKQIIGYEDRIIFIAEEGGIKIPWYMYVSVDNNNNETYTATVDLANGIYIHTPIKENQRYYFSKQ